jgi:hypothetical protein
MRFSSRALSLCLLVLPAVAAAQSKFEGVVTVSMMSARGNNDVSYSIKGDQLRMDMAGPGGQTIYMLRDASKNVNAMVMPEQRMYMDMSAMQGMIPPGAAGTPQTGKAPDITMTGRKETIAGYECEHMIVASDDGEKYDVCGANGLGSFMTPGGPMGMGGGRGRGMGGPPGLDRLGRDFFPLKVQKVGGEVALQVTKIEKKSLDNSVFAIPDGFQKMDPGMMRRPPN